jgi:hypothetical protein
MYYGAIDCLATIKKSDRVFEFCISLTYTSPKVSAKPRLWTEAETLVAKLRNPRAFTPEVRFVPTKSSTGEGCRAIQLSNQPW